MSTFPHVVRSIVMRRVSLLLLLLLLVGGTLHQGHRPALAQGQLERFAGVVTEQGQPGNFLAWAAVEVNGVSTVAGDGGNYELFVPSSSRYVVRTSHIGYAPDILIMDRPPLEELNLSLPQAEGFPFDPKQPLDVTDSQGTRIQIPEGALVTESGQPATAPLTLYLRTYELDEEAMPGDMSAINSSGQPVYLESAGAFSAEFRDGSGNRYNLAPGEQATVSIALPAGGSYPTTIDMWYLDETTGLWQEEGSATLINGRYEGQVSHFTLWNMDTEFSAPACIRILIPQALLDAETSILLSATHLNALGVQVQKTGTMAQLTNVLYNITPNVDVTFTVLSGSLAGQVFVVNSGPPWGGTGLPSFPYSACQTLDLTQNRVWIADPTPEPEPIYVGDVFTRSVQARGADVYALQTICTTNPAILTLQEAQVGTFFSPTALIVRNSVNPTEGEWFSVITQLNPAPPITGEGHLATLTYEASAVGTTTIDCTPRFANRDGGVLPSSGDSYPITVLALPELTGQVLYQGRTLHANITVDATGGAQPVTTLTDDNGNFALNLRLGTYDIQADSPLYLPACADNTAVTGPDITLPSAELRGGDLDDNLSVDGEDRAILQGVYDTNNPIADINADGIVSVQDFSIMSSNFNRVGCQPWP